MGVGRRYEIGTVFGVDGGLGNARQSPADFPWLHTQKGTFREN